MKTSKSGKSIGNIGPTRDTTGIIVAAKQFRTTSETSGPSTTISEAMKDIERIVQRGQAKDKGIQKPWLPSSVEQKGKLREQLQQKKQRNASAGTFNAEKQGSMEWTVTEYWTMRRKTDGELRRRWDATTVGCDDDGSVNDKETGREQKGPDRKERSDNR
uniref:Reverse transcriptase domain-containing protein n=1 Tax=Caenorhabditis tropicalis TaxID=1561998 RepID=A0A1I7T1Q8_9PELO